MPWQIASEKLAILFPVFKRGPFSKDAINPQPEPPRASPITHQVHDVIFSESLVGGGDLSW